LRGPVDGADFKAYISHTPLPGTTLIGSGSKVTSGPLLRL
jgi:hypothetical protein